MSITRDRKFIFSINFVKDTIKKYLALSLISVETSKILKYHIFW